MTAAILIGVGATLCIDLWALFVRKTFGVRSLDYCLLGRWVLHMREGRFTHASIAASTSQRHECPVGWAAHYSIGVGFAELFLLVGPEGWMSHPTFHPALGFGMATVVVPFLTMQPAFGLGMAASRTAHPWRARFKSLMTHGVFGVGLFVSASLLSRLR